MDDNLRCTLLTYKYLVYLCLSAVEIVEAVLIVSFDVYSFLTQHLPTFYFFLLGQLFIRSLCAWIKLSNLTENVRFLCFLKKIKLHFWSDETKCRIGWKKNKSIQVCVLILEFTEYFFKVFFESMIRLHDFWCVVIISTYFLYPFCFCFCSFGQILWTYSSVNYSMRCCKIFNLFFL